MENFARVQPPVLETADQPEHLASLPGGRWALWRRVGLRGAGFPAAHVLGLASAECAAAADRLIQSEDHASQAQQAALDHVLAAIDALRRDQRWDAVRRHDPLVRLFRLLKKGKLPKSHASDTPTLAALRAARADAETARQHLRDVFAATLAQTSQTIYAISQSEHFREALIWQNRHAFHTSVAVLRQPDDAVARGSWHRKDEELIASYVQRYSVKNDTIGFFGPVGWASFLPDGPAATTTPGAGLLAARNVYLEVWGVDALAEALGRNRALYPWIAPRRDPLTYLDGTTLIMPEAAPLRLSPIQAAILQACDGQRTAKELAAQLIRTPATGLRNEVEVYNHLAILRNKGLIIWALETPYQLRPEQALRQLLERIGDERARTPALNALAQYEAARDAVAAVAGQAAGLDRALAELEATFTRLTGTAATRFHGKTYAGRTLIYEDCRRDIEVSFGPELLAALAPPLTLLLAGARWFVSEVGQVYRAVFQEVYAELVRQSGSPTVGFTSFWLRALPLMSEDKRHVRAILAAFQERWAAVLALSPGQRRVVYTSDELRSRVEAAFAAPAVAWPSARYHSPDVLIAASGADAIRRGEYELVLGELHIGFNTLAAALFLDQHPSKAEFLRAIDHDLPEARVVPLTPRQWPGLTGRTMPMLVSAKDVRLEIARDTPGPPGALTLPISSFVVEQSVTGLVARTRDGAHSFDIMESCAGALMLLAPNEFKLFPPAPHTPRITLDRLVIYRESWSFPASELPFVYAKDELERFLAARRWAHAHGMPRFVFVRVPVEVKPFYLDFDSPIYVDIFAKMIRRTAEHGQEDGRVGVAEMLPDPTQMWLPDAQDQRYASELRLVALDLAR